MNEAEHFQELAETDSENEAATEERQDDESQDEDEQEEQEDDSWADAAADGCVVFRRSAGGRRYIAQFCKSERQLYKNASRHCLPMVFDADVLSYSVL